MLQPDTITGIPSTHHQTLLFVGQDGKVGRARGNQKMEKSCNLVNRESIVPQKQAETEKVPEKARVPEKTIEK